MENTDRLEKNFPKIHCPYERVHYEINKEDWMKYGTSLGLRSPKVYLAMPSKNCTHDMEWVWGEQSYAVEKLHGTNLCIDVKDGHLVHMQNRLNVHPFTQLIGNKQGLPLSGRFLEGIVDAASRGYVENNKIQYGELIGPKLNGNIHKLDRHLWYPFERAKKHLRYSSFSKHPKEYWGWCEWFRTNLKSLLYCRLNEVKLSMMNSDPKVPFTEGIVIYKDGEEGQYPLMAKLRRDMFYWYYCDKIEIYGLDCFVDHARANGIKMKGYLD